MKSRFIVYVILAIAFQVGLGYFTGQGQGGIAMLLFIILVEFDPQFSFSYLVSKRRHEKKESK